MCYSIREVLQTALCRERSMKRNLISIIGLIAAFILIACSNPGTPPPSGEKEFLSFSYQVPDQEVTINADTSTISGILPWDTNLGALTPVFTHNGSSVSVEGETQTSGISVLDFYSPVQYIIAAEDSTEQEYTVRTRRNLIDEFDRADSTVLGNGWGVSLRGTSPVSTLGIESEELVFRGGGPGNVGDNSVLIRNIGGPEFYECEIVFRMEEEQQIELWGFVSYSDSVTASISETGLLYLHDNTGSISSTPVTGFAADTRYRFLFRFDAGLLYAEVEDLETGSIAASLEAESNDAPSTINVMNVAGGGYNGTTSTQIALYVESVRVMVE